MKGYEKMKKQNVSAVIYALSAALFYALNIPCSKLLLEHIPPTFMAGILYIGAGFGVSIMYFFHYKKESSEERLEKNDLPYTIGMIILDIAAPVLLMLGIHIGSSANATLLGNFEIVATSLIAFAIFKEKISKYLCYAIFLITISSIILSFSGSNSLVFSLGSLLVLGASVCWGLENNCTRKISQKSTYQIVAIKGLCSGTGSIIIALVTGEHIPALKYISFALLLGYVAYGLSIFTYIRAQKSLGAAKTSAYYAVAPFIGTFLSFVILKESVSVQYIAALLIMLAGTVLVVIDTFVYQHKHEHAHTFTHTHGGSTHSHTIIHSHDHNHYFCSEKHSHTHSIKELEMMI